MAVLESSTAQITDSIPDTPNSEPINLDSLESFPADTLITNDLSADSITQDTLPSNEVINASIYYNADDSIVFDAVEQKVYLYGNAIVRYEKLELKAAFIEYGFQDNLACANGILDTAGQYVGKPSLNDDGQEFSQKSMCYNFKTSRGYSREVVTSEGEAFVHSEIAKRQENEWVHIRRGKFTTCDAENPHYHFHLSKAIIIPDDKIVAGPVYMKVRKVPTPLALPFGFFPNKRESAHGIILPGYGDSETLGFFLQNGGYYIPINDNVDTRMLFDIYSRGSWSARNLTNYKKRYRYNGNINISRTVRRTGFPELDSYQKSTDFFVKWTHNQDVKARPNSRFGASINLGTSNNFRNNLNTDQSDFLQSTFTSSANWSRSWAGRPYNLSIRGSHTQNTQTRNVDVILPSVTFSVSRFYLPLSFLNTKAGSSKKWYEKIGVNYSVNFDNQLSSTEPEIRWDRFDQLIRQTKNGVKHTATVNTSLKALNGFVTINPTFNYNEYWAFKYLEVGLNEDSLVSERDTLFGFRSARDWRFNVNANTKIFGMFGFKNSKNIKAFRHVMTPNVGFRYDPYRNYNITGYYGDDGELLTYSEFDASRYRPSGKNEAASMTFGLANNLEMKVRDKKADKLAYKKVKLIESFNINSSYNFLADSLNLANFAIRGYTNVTRNVNLNLNATYNPYDRDSTGRDINTFLWDSQGIPARLSRANAGVVFKFRSQNRTGERKTENVTEEELEIANQNPGAFVDFNVPWTLNLSYSLNLFKVFDPSIQADTNRITQSILFNGDFTILKKWKLGFDSGYDIVAKDWTPTTLSVYWDLHCWEFSVNWIPIGIRKSVNFQLNVKASMLQDLKLQRRQNYGDDSLLY